MRQASRAIAKAIEDALGRMRVRPSQIAGQLGGDQVAPAASGSRGTIDLDDVLSDPTTTAGDLIYRSGSGLERLAIGTSGYVLTAGAGAPAWSAASGGDMTNPMTTAGDLIIGGTAGAPARLAIGTSGQVLTVSGGTAAWSGATSYGQGCRVWRSTNQSIATATDTAISFDTERDDTDSMWSSSPNPTRIEIVTTGVYAFGAGVVFAPNGTGARVAQIRRSATTTLAYDQRIGNGSYEIAMTLSSRAALSAGDYLELIVYQDSGGSLNVRSYNDFSPILWAQRVG